VTDDDNHDDDNHDASVKSSRDVSDYDELNRNSQERNE